MRATPLLALTVLASVTFVTGAAMAGDAVYLTPPLFREQAHKTQQVRGVRDLTTTPQPVAATRPLGATRLVRIVADVETTASH